MAHDRQGGLVAKHAVEECVRSEPDYDEIGLVSTRQAHDLGRRNTDGQLATPT